MTTGSPPQDTGRRRRRVPERGGGSGAPQPPGQPESPFAPLELVSLDELESIHQAALAVLKEIGIDFLHDEARTMREVCPGGHFFGAEHTQSRYRTAFFPPAISDWRNYETWREAGSPTAVDPAERIVADRLRDFVAPPLEAERLEALTAFVARRKAEGGAPTDY
jgi:trimethylamine:corrinoid methyltransferase-like protein